MSQHGGIFPPYRHSECVHCLGQSNPVIPPYRHSERAHYVGQSNSEYLYSEPDAVMETTPQWDFLQLPTPGSILLTKRVARCVDYLFAGPHPTELVRKYGEHRI
jgi:hypothetical protein